MRVAAVLAGGVLYALALPPFDWSLCGWLTLVPLLCAVRGSSTGAAFRYGVLYGYASGWAATWCFADAAMRYFELPLPIAVLALAIWYLVVCGLPFGLFAAGCSVVLRAGTSGGAALVIAALWVTSEFLRGYVMGQPWGLLGYTQYGHLALIQVATVAGVYGVSFLLALGNTAMAELLDVLARTAHATNRRLTALAIAAAAVVACWYGGSMAIPPVTPGDPGTTQVAIVQTNVAPALHWTRAYTDAQVAAHVSATDRLPIAGPSLIVWPENSVPRYLEREPMLAVQLAALARRHEADLLFGGPRYDGTRTYNSARLIRASGTNGGHYDKRRLVLFAEEKPLTTAVGGMDPTESPEEFTPGSGSGVLASFVPVGVSICHEIVHPDLIRAAIRDGAELLVNLANDGWLDGGYQFAGRQHLAMAVFRAVETRRFVIRAATTGTSAVIDPYGRLLASQAPNTAGVVRAGVTGERAMTPYVQVGDLFALVCVAVVMARFVRWPMRLRLRRPERAEAPAAC
jgi:apolipoprotein N-acyltransferase